MASRRFDIPPFNTPPPDWRTVGGSWVDGKKLRAYNYLGALLTWEEIQQLDPALRENARYVPPPEPEDFGRRMVYGKAVHIDELEGARYVTPKVMVTPDFPYTYSNGRAIPVRRYARIPPKKDKPPSVAGALFFGGFTSLLWCSASVLFGQPVGAAFSPFVFITIFFAVCNYGDDKSDWEKRRYDDISAKLDEIRREKPGGDGKD